MAVYAITGKMGTGKGKAAIQRLRQYLRQGKRVATNCDVFLEHLMGPQSRATVVRIPDKPSPSDLYAIGSGNKFIQFDPIIQSTDKGYVFTPPSPKLLEGFDESHNGALILDECASWLNTRDFQSKGRAELLEWAIHGRKYGWDIYFICQNIKQVDAQLRESLFEYVVRMSRLDRLKVPFLSAGVRLITAGMSDGTLPRMHIGVVRLGPSPTGIVAERWNFRGDDLNKGYNTTQVFSDSYPHAIHSVLSSWHLQAQHGVPPDFRGPPSPDGRDAVLIKFRPLPPKKPHRFMKQFLLGSALLGCAVGSACTYALTPIITRAVSPPPKTHTYSDKISGKGYFRQGAGVVVLLSDGRSITPMQFKTLPSGWEAQIDANTWVMGGAQ